MVIPQTHILCKEIEGRRVLATSYSQIETFENCPYRWYKTYVEGNRRMTKHEATSYGTVIHQMMEYFFKNGCRPTYADMSKAFNYYAEKEDIPFDSLESQLTAMRQAGELIIWLVGLFERRGREYKRAYDTLNPMEKVIRGSRPAGVEEDFVLPYKLPKPVVVDNELHDKIHIIGSVDWRGEFRVRDRTVIYTIDWKSGKSLFDEKKIAHNLQHPIYAFYIYRRYGTLPDMCSYFFTRQLKWQNVKVDKEKMVRSVMELNTILRKMYDFDTGCVSYYNRHVWDKGKNQGKGGYIYVKEPLPGTLPACMEPRPKPLCFWCDFSKHKENICPYSSDWDESRRVVKK